MNKKGFTLIELLAVIVILAVIALIVTPVVSGIIGHVKLAADLRSAEGYVKAAEDFYAGTLLDSNKAALLGTNVIDQLPVSNKKATGDLIVNKNGSVDMAIVINNKCYKKTAAQTIGQIDVSDDVDNCSLTAEVATPARCFEYEGIDGHSVTVNSSDTVGLNACKNYLYEKHKTDDGVDSADVFTNFCSTYLETGYKQLSTEEIEYLQSDATNHYLTINDVGDLKITNYLCGSNFKKITTDYYQSLKDGEYDDVVIPSQINGHKVVEIATGAFMRDEYSTTKFISSVVLPSTIKTIANDAFMYNSVQSATFRSGIETIGDGAFENNQLTNVVIPSSVKSIGNSAFSGNKITSLTLVDGLESIGASAFNSNQISSLYIPKGVTELLDRTFRYNVLENITGGENVTTYGEYAFDHNKMKSFVFSDKVTSIGGYLFDNNELTEVTIGSSVNDIESEAFYKSEYSNANLTHIYNKSSIASNSSVWNNALTGYDSGDISSVSITTP